jgi:tyrosyl-tRNA synthetase
VDDIIDELSWRGLLAVSTDIDELRQALNSGRVTIYCGFDPTAAGLHVGNLVQLVTLRRLQLAGHRPIGLVGGATGLIGDPSGKSAERVLNPRETVAQWVEQIRGEVSRFLDFDAGESSALIVSNLDWTESMPVLDFLRDIGKHFSVNRMLDREAVRAGWRQPGSATPSSATNCSRRWTSWSFTAGTAVPRSSAVVTSGATWSRAWT